MSATITVVMVTLNEERMLSSALDSVLGLADEILVGDLGSSDASVTIAQQRGATVLALPPAPAVEQVRPVLVEQARGDWILLLDPDEVLEPLLADRLREEALAARHDAVEMTFYTYMMGRRLRGSGWSPSRERHVRFFRKGSVDLRPEVHSPLKPQDESRLVRLDESAGVVHHFNYVSWEQFVEKMNRYTSVEAAERHRNGQRASASQLLKEMSFEIASRGVHDRAWRDGWRGASLLLLMLAYRTSVFSKHRLLTEIGTQRHVIEADRRVADRILRGRK